MPGMSNASLGSLGLSGPFYHRLLLEALVLAAIGVVFIAARYLLFGELFAPRGGLAVRGGAGTAGVLEPKARRVLRYGFGALWIFDGLLQMQGSMPASLVGSVISPVEAGEPGWLVHLVGVGTAAWQRHPIWAASGVVWIQLAIGLWLVLGKSGTFAKVGYILAAAWGMVVWVLGEGLGQLLAPGASWLFGAPGAVVFYVIAALLLLAPWSWWQRDRIPRWTLTGLGILLIAFGALEAWPGRGFYGGQIVAMIRQMAANSQPALISGPMRAVADAMSKGWAAPVNAVVAVVMIASGISFITRRLLGITVPAFIFFSLVVWWFVQDFGFLGGVGTDPNSILPQLVIVASSYMGLATIEMPLPLPTRFWPEVVGTAGRLFGGWIAVLAAFGAAPLGFSALNQSYSVQAALAVSGAPFAVNTPAPNFTLTDQYGKKVTLSQFASKRIVFTNLDPTCTFDCPLIASELRVADANLTPAQRANTVFIAIASNPDIHSVRSLDIFDQREGLSGLKNWYFLTSSSLRQLTAVWTAYQIQVSVPTNGSMVLHPDVLYVMGRGLVERWELSSAPSTATSVQNSFSSLVVNLVSQS